MALLRRFAVLSAAVLAASIAQAQETPTAAPTTAPPAVALSNQTVDMHLAAAKNAAGFDHTGTLTRICIAPQTGPGEDRAPSAAPPREAWFVEPAKVFDNLYFVGTKIHSAWALVAEGGDIILIDTLYEYAAEESIVGGMKKLGLDPARVKYTLISHWHGDHIAGAPMMQAKYKSRIVMGEKDWVETENSKFRFPNGKPTRDIVVKDGETISVGDVSVKLFSTPGHTPDTFSFLFQVKDKGKPLTVIYNGGTAFNFVNDVPHFDIYIASQRKMQKLAQESGATVLMTNHSEFDNATTKVRMMASRKDGEPSPFEIGSNAVRRYFRVTEECALAARLKLLQKAKVD